MFTKLKTIKTSRKLKEKYYETFKKLKNMLRWSFEDFFSENFGKVFEKWLGNVWKHQRNVLKDETNPIIVI